MYFLIFLWILGRVRIRIRIYSRRPINYGSTGSGSGQRWSLNKNRILLTRSWFKLSRGLFSHPPEVQTIVTNSLVLWTFGSRHALFLYRFFICSFYYRESREVATDTVHWQIVHIPIPHFVTTELWGRGLPAVVGGLRENLHKVNLSS